MKKRIISSILLASMTLAMAACNNTDTNGSNDTIDSSASQDDILPAGIEKQNYGKDVNIAILEWGLYNKYFDPGDDMTDIMNKALYNRELKVEEYLGVDITYDFVGDWDDLYDVLSTVVTTNDDLYQIALNHCLKKNADLITDGMIIDMNELNIDFTGEWFNQSANDALEVAGKQFFCVSDYMLPDPNAFLFNKELIEKNNLEDPYQLVRDGKWTIDKVGQLASAVTADNGDGIWNAKDTYGFSCPDNWFGTSFIYGCDVDIISKNDDGEFEIAFGDERTYTMMEKLDTLINSPDTLIFNHNVLAGNTANLEKAILIESGRCLFTIYPLNILWQIRDIEVDFGILPFPKLDEEQENYISNDWTGLMCVPMSLNDESYEMVGDVIELLSYYSEEEVIPAYIDATLGLKLARDPESKEMLEIIFDGCTFDPGLNYFGNASGTYDIVSIVSLTLMDKGENNLASYLAANLPAAESAINAFNMDIHNLDK